MNRINQSKNLNAKKKIFPGLGGKSKTYLRKPKILHTTLEFLGDFLENFLNQIKLQNDEKEILKILSSDIKKLGKIERYKKFDFYSLCQDIVKKYNK